MKKINILTKKILYACLFISVVLSSCVKNDLLDRDDPAGLDGAKAWTTDYLTRLGLNGVYSALRLGAQTTTSTPLGMELYQFDKFVTSQDRNSHAFLTGTANPSIMLAYYTWQYMYEGIGRANDAIYNIPEKSESAPADKARYVAEAKFLRAYFYFRLNQVFKGVPIFEEPITVQNSQIARDTEQKVWDFILQDLEDCIKEANLPNKYDKGNKEYGRVTKGAAYALRGKVYMYLKKWDDAIKDFNEVEKCGYGLFQGGYKELFKETNEQCEEMIFSIQHIDTPGYGSTINLFAGTRAVFGQGWNHYMVAPHTVDRYENLDGSPFNWDDVIPGYNAMAPADREVYFLRDTVNLENKLQEWGFSDDPEALKTEARAISGMVRTRLEAIKKNGNGAEKLYLPDGNEARIKKAYENRDPRLQANVITPYSTFNGALSTAENLVTMRWPYRSENKGIQDLRSDLGTQFLYFHRKFIAEGTNETPNRMYSPIDHPIIRFADVVLMKAEALNEAGKTPEAVIEVNKVRQRAGVGLLDSSPATKVKDQADLRERIRNERRIEFVNEGLSYFDELRWGSLKETVYAGGNGGAKQVWGTITIKFTWPDDDRKAYIWPIPQTEMDRNENLEQNEAWKNT